MYGTGTRSYNRSAEARENKRKQKAATEQYLEAQARGELQSVTVSLLCRCLSWEFPHELEAHKQLKGDWDWPTPEERLQRNRDFWERSL